MSDRNATPRRERIERGIYRRPDGKLEIGWRDSRGVQRWRRVEKGGITAARAALTQAHAERNRGERVAADPRLRFDDAATAWWEARVVKLRPATQNAYGAGLAHLRKPEHFGRARLADVTPADVADYITRQEKAGLKGWTIKGHMTVLSSVFTYAARHLGLVGANPCTLLDRVERPSSDDEKPKRVLTPVELERLLAAVAPSHRALFTVGAETGARLSEVMGLTWQDVDLDGETVSFTHQLDRHGERVPLKTARSRRCLEVTPALVSRLRAHKLASRHSGPHDLVFANRVGKGLDHRNVGGRVLARAVELAGLEAVKRGGVVVSPAPTFHSLRHSHASQLIAAGWDIEEVSARLGHSSVATTQRIYVHEFDAARRSAERRDRLAKLYPGVEAPVEAADGDTGQEPGGSVGAEVRSLRASGDGGQ